MEIAFVALLFAGVALSAFRLGYMFGYKKGWDQAESLYKHLDPYYELNKALRLEHERKEHNIEVRKF